MALLLELGDLALLVLGQHLRHDLRHPQLLADGVGGAVVVAGEHDDVNAQLPEGGHCGPAGGFQRIRHGDEAQHGGALGKIEGGLALGGQLLGPVQPGQQVDSRLLHHGPVARQTHVSAQSGPQPPAMDRLKPGHGSLGQAFGGGGLHDGRAQGVLGGGLQTGGQAQQGALRQAVRRHDVRHLGLALGEGAGFVHDHGVNGVQRLQGLGGFDQDAVFRALPGAHHDGHRGGQTQGAGAGDDQHGHAPGEGGGDAAGDNQPDRGGHGGNDHHHGYEDARHLVGQLGDGGLGGGRLLHQADHLGQGGVLPHPQGLKNKRAGLVDGRGGHLVPHRLVHREALAGQGALVHGGRALHDDAVHRDGLPRPDGDFVAHPDLLHRDLHLRAVPQHVGGLGGQVHQAGDGLAGLALGAGLQEFAQGDQGQYHTGRLEIEVHMVLLHPFHIAVAQAIADLEDGEHAVDDGGDGPDSDEGIHVGRAVEEGLEAVFKVFVVEVHDWQGQQELHQGEGGRVFHPGQEPRQRRAHHVAHGDIEEGDEEDEGPDQPVLHLGQLLGHDVLLWLRRPGRGRFPGQGRAVADGLHGADDALRRDRALVIGDLHVVCQQVDADVGHAGGLAHGLFHMGRAGRAGHPRDLKGLFHKKAS